MKFIDLNDSLDEPKEITPQLIRSYMRKIEENGNYIFVDLGDLK